MRNVIVTGATGMVGATLINILRKEDIQVTAVIRPESVKIGNIDQIEGINIVECDIGNYEKLKKQLKKEYDTWFHFAWNGTYGESRNDVRLQEQNIMNTIIAVDTAYELGCQSFIGAGSQAEFGYIDGVISDKQPKNPVTAYGIAKYCAGKLSRIECERKGLRHCWGRIVSTYGPMDNSYTMVMSSLAGMLEGRRMQFTKGEQEWDYLYSEDCARAFYLMGISGIDGKSYTVASGKSRKLKEYIAVMRDMVDEKLEIGIGELPYYPNQVMSLVADISELQKDTGFSPVTNFEEGIQNTIQWYQSIGK